MSISSLSAAAHQPRGTETPKATPAGPPWSEENAQRRMRQVAAGDTTAFEQLYHHYAPRLAIFLRRHLGAAEVICITLLINRPPRRDVHIGNRECDARSAGELECVALPASDL
jgi:hypothetical protein